MTDSTAKLLIEMLNRSFSKALIYFGDGRMNEIEACFMILDAFTHYYVEGEIAALLPKIPNSIILLIRDQLHEIVHLGIERRVTFVGKAFSPEQNECDPTLNSEMNNFM